MACAGTLAAWPAAGCEARVLIVNAGQKGSDDPGASPVEVAALRAGEVADAVAVLG